MDKLLLERVKVALETRKSKASELQASAKELASAVKLAVDHGGWSMRSLARELKLSAARVHQIYQS